MQRPTNLHLSFDIDALTPPHAGSRGNTAWLTERKITDLQDRQTVHLTGDGSLHIFHNGAAIDLLITALAVPVTATNMHTNGFLHMRRANLARPSLRRVMIGLAQQILHQTQL
jgi:hypothetical protein